MKGVEVKGVTVVRQDGTRENVECEVVNLGGMAFRAGSDFHLRRVRENPDVWECRCLIAIMGTVHQCPSGEQVEDPFREDCTANWKAGRGMSKSAAVQDLCNKLKNGCDAFWGGP